MSLNAFLYNLASVVSDSDFDVNKP